MSVCSGCHYSTASLHSEFFAAMLMLKKKKKNLTFKIFVAKFECSLMYIELMDALRNEVTRI